MKSYVPKYYWFEALECGRRLLLASVIGLVSAESAAAPVLGIICSLAFVQVFNIMPFRDPNDSVLGVILAYCLVLLFLGALMIKVDATSDDEEDQAVFSYLLIATLLAGPVAAFIMFGSIARLVFCPGPQKASEAENLAELEYEEHQEGISEEGGGTMAQKGSERDGDDLYNPTSDEELLRNLDADQFIGLEMTTTQDASPRRSSRDPLAPPMAVGGGRRSWFGGGGAKGVAAKVKQGSKVHVFDDELNRNIPMVVRALDKRNGIAELRPADSAAPLGVPSIKWITIAECEAAVAKAAAVGVDGGTNDARRPTAGVHLKRAKEEAAARRAARESVDRHSFDEGGLGIATTASPPMSPSAVAHLPTPSLSPVAASRSRSRSAAKSSRNLNPRRTDLGTTL